MATNIEASVKEIYTYAQKYLDLLNERNPQAEKDGEQKAKVEITIGENKYFHGDRYPSCLVFGNLGGMCMTRGSGEKSIKKLLDEMLKETKEEYETYRDTNMVPAIGCGKTK